MHKHSVLKFAKGSPFLHTGSSRVQKCGNAQCVYGRGTTRNAVGSGQAPIAFECPIVKSAACRPARSTKSCPVSRATMSGPVDHDIVEGATKRFHSLVRQSLCCSPHCVKQGNVGKWRGGQGSCATPVRCVGSSLQRCGEE